MFSRPLIILLALVAAVYRITTGALVEASGLILMALGLTFLQMAPKRPALKNAAIACFLATAVVIGFVIYRNAQ
ncbi:MAG: hypothetical protein O2917_00790 [Acidobacteria bacterium]|nr:hypothetical protein [Acidobacteriota bacterium]